MPTYLTDGTDLSAIARPFDARERWLAETRERAALRRKPPRGALGQLTHGEAPVPIVAAAGFIAAAVLLLAIAIAADLIDFVRYPQLVAWLVLSFSVAFVVLGWWWLRGVGRAALRQMDRGGSAAFGLLVFACASGGQLWMINHVFSGVAPTIFEFAGVAAGLDPVRIDLDRSKTVLKLQGEFGLGATRALERALDANPGVRTIELLSPGGYVREGMAIAQLIESRGLNTSAPLICHSMCVAAFAAGRERLITASTRMGLHSAGGAGVSQSRIDLANRITDEYLYRRGVNRRLLDKGADTPFEDIWVPEPSILWIAGLATAYVSP